MLSPENHAMGILEAVIRALIAIALVVLAAALLFWGLAYLGIVIPPFVTKILMFILGLIVLLYIVRLFYPYVAGFTVFPPGPPRPPGT